MKKKMYQVEWLDSWGVPYADLIYAKDPVHAWKKIKRQHPFTANCFIRILELTDGNWKEIK